MSSSKAKKYVRIVFGVIMAAAGLAHFTHAEFFNQLVPESAAAYGGIILAVTGIYQIAVGVCFWVPRLHVVARWGTIVLLVGTLPFAIDQVIHPEAIESVGISAAAAAVRVVVQVLEVWLVWWATSPDKPAAADRQQTQ